MAAVARKRELDYPIDEEWRERVKAALGHERGAQARLAREIKCAESTLTDLLAEGKRSHLVPRIHKALGWPPPPSPSEVLDGAQVATALAKVDERTRGQILALLELDPAQRDIALKQLELTIAIFNTTRKND